jgi:hypothetical protein
MKQTSRDILIKWKAGGINLTSVERVLHLPFGELINMRDNEGPAPPELEVLLNLIDLYPMLFDVAEREYKF